MPARKGVSAVIASVLIVLVTVALISTYSLWSSRIFGQVTSTAEQSTQATTKALFSNIGIESVSDQRVFIKNTGTSDLTTNALTVYYDSQPINFTADFSTLSQNGLGTLVLSGLWKYGPGSHSLRVSAGVFSDTKSVTASAARGAGGDWRFEEGTGSTTADASGNGNTGTLTSSPIWVQNTPYTNAE